jgi:diguanylate cyclase (GGDEF)-like protein/PAS domain S-box-containing protein
MMTSMQNKQENHFPDAVPDIGGRGKVEELSILESHIVESIGTGMAIADASRPGQPIIYVNPAFEAITGYSAAEVSGRHLHFLFGDNADAPGSEWIRQGIQGQRKYHIELQSHRKDGSPFWSKLEIIPVHADSGEPTHYVLMVTDITEVKYYQNQLEHNSTHDELTGLPNRNLLHDRLGYIVNCAHRNGYMVGVLFIDLDDFKYINESFGHGGGDMIIKGFAERLKDRVRESDTIARRNGDEFVLVLPCVNNEADVEIVARKLLDMAVKPYNFGGQKLSLGFSIGVSLYPRDGKDAETLLKNAEMAMFLAKRQGKARFGFYIKETDGSEAEQLPLDNQMYRALERNEFMLHYQTQVNLNTRQITGVEALIRWRHPSKGLLAPDAFIPLAEKTGLIDPIGEWMIKTACRQNKSWQREGMPPLQLTVNISTRQLQKKNFFETVSRALKESKLEAKCLDLKITEGTMIPDIQAGAAMLEKIKSLGIRISLAAFGTGYSSLNYLKSLPIDAIHVDKSFVQGVTANPDDATIVKAIIAMSHNLKLIVNAEGVETDGQFLFLARHKCDTAQGLLFGPALPAEDFIRFVRRDWNFPLDKHENQTGQRTLLIVDDEPNIRSALVRLLRGSGYQVITADSGKAGLELLAVNNVNVIISDYRMPEMNGVEFSKRVKELYPNIIRILLSGFIDLQVVTDAINQGAVYKILGKPWEDAALRSTIREAFELFDASTANPGHNPLALTQD